MKHKLTQNLLEKWARKKAYAWAYDNYAPSDRYWAKYEIKDDTWFELEMCNDGVERYEGEIILEVTIGLDYEGHWEQKGYTDSYEPQEVLEDIYEVNKEIA